MLQADPHDIVTLPCGDVVTVAYVSGHTAETCGNWLPPVPDPVWDALVQRIAGVLLGAGLNVDLINEDGDIGITFGRDTAYAYVRVCADGGVIVQLYSGPSESWKHPHGHTMQLWEVDDLWEMHLPEGLDPFTADPAEYVRIVLEVLAESRAVGIPV